ncbi:hypothetical protein H1R17_13875 [Flavobacterium sp. xlx-214]|uniref:DUF2947 family protein n=1 Tax=unclassified Flavobacterium TaxID=196869 RepID=UPI0013D0C70B|nr:MULTISPECIES: DUF2947 family protein [unclassified Flavobacterium]MBA5791317.1 hypothetical protein [Flavobacterium sp. xlx-221]QMI83525.1 hypothetical protein H1R17_13875 [Flavobacterium sp. xlx-214]
MKIEIDEKEIISLSRFELGWRFNEINMSEQDLSQLFPLNENESKKIYKIIQFYENGLNINEKYIETNWFRASSETEEKIRSFRKVLENNLSQYNEDLIISWHRKTSLKTSKDIFIKYWTAFLYSASDDVTIISVNLNWVLIYHHTEVANLWIKK